MPRSKSSKRVMVLSGERRKPKPLPTFGLREGVAAVAILTPLWMPLLYVAAGGPLDVDRILALAGLGTVSAFAGMIMLLGGKA